MGQAVTTNPMYEERTMLTAERVQSMTDNQFRNLATSLKAPGHLGDIGLSWTWTARDVRQSEGHTVLAMRWDDSGYRTAKQARSLVEYLAKSPLTVRCWHIKDNTVCPVMVIPGDVHLGLMFHELITNKPKGSGPVTVPYGYRTRDWDDLPEPVEILARSLVWESLLSSYVFPRRGSAPGMVEYPNDPAKKTARRLIPASSIPGPLWRDNIHLIGARNVDYASYVLTEELKDAIAARANSDAGLSRGGAKW